jgi:hypothetical protein
VTIHTIEIFRGEDVWMAKVSVVSPLYGALAAEPLPTPFLSWVPACQVKERLQELNPNARIVFLEEVTPL